jgi:hypothetical protein
MLATGANAKAMTARISDQVTGVICTHYNNRHPRRISGQPHSLSFQFARSRLSTASMYSVVVT